MEIKKLSVKEFRAAGYLQALNRHFLHPLGMALEVVIDDKTGEESFGEAWDSRNDPDGMTYGGSFDVEKARKVETEMREKHSKRKERLGFVVEPIPKENRPKSTGAP